MADHAAPGGNQAQTQQLRADKGSGNPDEPHADDIVNKGRCGLSDALHQALHDDRNTVERFRDSDHPQNCGSQTDHIFIRTEQAYQRLRKQEEQAAGDDHQPHLERQDCTSQTLQPVMILCTIGDQELGTELCDHIHVVQHPLTTLQILCRLRK